MEVLTTQQCMRWAFQCAVLGNVIGQRFWVDVSMKIRMGARVTLDDLPKPKPINMGELTWPQKD